MSQEFQTGVDPFFIVWPTLLLMIQASIYVFTIPIMNTVAIILLATISLCITVCLLAIATTKYVVTEDSLIIHNLIYRKSYVLNQLCEWKLCKHSISFYAASTRQIELVFGIHKIHISPIKREELVKILEKKSEF